MFTQYLDMSPSCAELDHAMNSACEPLAPRPQDLVLLQQLVSEGDIFALLGVAYDFAVDTCRLRQNYLELTRLTHPDFYADLPEKIGDILTLSAAVNNAYRILTDTVRRAEYVLQRQGGVSAGDNKSVPQALLMEVMEIREQIDAAKAAGQDEVLTTLERDIKARRETALATITALGSKLTEANDPKAQGDAETLKELRLQLNAAKYLDGILAAL